ncbi:MAG: alpha/beta fold hydrolase [Balneolaceae bacterium]
MNANIIAFHGWGCEASVWTALRSELPESIQFTAADRGYFGRPNRPDSFPTNALPNLLITHSMGLLWCPAALMEQADGVVIISGFKAFIDEAVTSGSSSRRVLDRMVRKLDEQPGQVLSDFLSRAWYPDPCQTDIPEPIEINRIRNDLFMLRDEPARLSRLKAAPALILHGAEDAIVSPNHTQRFEAELHPNSSYFVHPLAGHMLPVSHPVWCAEKITQWMESIS